MIPLVVANLLIFLSYTILPLGLLFFLKGRRDLSQYAKVMLILFITFVQACGISHLIEVWNYWYADYYLEMYVKVFTAIVSVATAYFFIRHIGFFINLPSPKDFQNKNLELLTLNAELEDTIKKRSELIQAKREYLELILDTSEDAIIEYIPKYNALAQVIDFRSSVVNDKVEKQFHVKEDAVATDSVIRDQVFLKESGLFDKYIEVLKTGVAYTAEELQDPVSNNWFHVVVARKPDKKSIVCFFRNVTDMLERKQNFIKNTKFAAIVDMAGGIAHEINTPLQIIAGNLREMERKSAASQMLESEIRPIQASVERISRITESLLRLVEPKEVSMNQMSVKKLLDELLIYNEGKIRAYVGRLVLDYQENDDLEVYLDEISALKVLSQFLRNAIGASNKNQDSKIKITLEDVEERVNIEIWDNGKGVSSELESKLFLPFQGKNYKDQGPSLGLSLSKSLADSMDGEVSYSKKQGFTVFTLSLRKVMA